MCKTKDLFIAFLLLSVALVPHATTHALLISDGRYQKQEELHKALDTAASHYRSNQALSSLSSRSERALEESVEKMPALARQKREVRLQLSAARSTLLRLKEEHGIDPADAEHMLKLRMEGEEQLRLLVRFLHVRGVSDQSESANGLLRQYLVSSLGERTEQGMRDKAMLRARARLLGMIATAEQFKELESELRQQHEELQDQYIALLKQSEVAKRRMHASAGGQAEIKRIVEEVHEQILKMQSELARIDARIRRRAERTLIEKGIITTREGAYNDGAVVSGSTQLSWPVLGPISAGYMNKSYRGFFGVDHQGIDIVVPQGTPVRAAADGVVFLARDGGQTGYSYVLIGHRSGTATLYGHLSQISVVTGQDINHGQVLGLSGGTPGTYGAGPMTTGAHLHLEVIQKGVHVDPLLLLPSR